MKNTQACSDPWCMCWKLFITMFPQIPHQWSMISKPKLSPKPCVVSQHNAQCRGWRSLNIFAYSMTRAGYQYFVSLQAHWELVIKVWIIIKAQQVVIIHFMVIIVRAYIYCRTLYITLCWLVIQWCWLI